MILIEILEFKKWEPLSKTKKLGALTVGLSPLELDHLHDEFAKYILLFYQALVMNAIKTQRFPGRYRPHSPRYAKAKRKKGLNKGFWIASGFLVKNIQIWKRADGAWIIGFPEDLLHPVSKTPVATIALANELGSEKKNIPARPLFIPLGAAISKSIFPHFKKFIKAKFPAYRKYIP